MTIVAHTHPFVIGVDTDARSHALSILATHIAQTKAYVERRIAEGLTRREIRRILKRYLARQIHRALTVASRADEPAANPIPTAALIA